MGMTEPHHVKVFLGNIGNKVGFPPCNIMIGSAMRTGNHYHLQCYAAAPSVCITAAARSANSSHCFRNIHSQPTVSFRYLGSLLCSGMINKAGRVWPDQPVKRALSVHRSYGGCLLRWTRKHDQVCPGSATVAECKQGEAIWTVLTSHIDTRNEAS